MTKQHIKILEDKIANIKALMLAYATDGRQDNHSQLYQELFIDLDVMLQAAGYSNPNKHKTIESFWEQCGPTWADRRAYIANIYADVLLDLGRRRKRLKDPRHWSEANELLRDELSPIRQPWLKAKNYIYTTPPDYENSIKESINSIESTLMILLHEPGSTLGKLVKKAGLDPDIENLISRVYGLVSNKDFVRHGGTTARDLGKPEAEFFLELAAIVIVYLKEKIQIP